jgi:hypothetical protein
MPKFYEMVEVETEVWVDVQEFIDQCSEKEIQKMIKILAEDGQIKKRDIKSKNNNLSDEMWQEKVEKILENRLILTDEEILVIEKIAGRL